MKSDIIRNTEKSSSINLTVDKLFGIEIEEVKIMILGNAFIN